MTPIPGIIGDRMSRKWWIVGCLCLWSGVTYSMRSGTAYAQLYLVSCNYGTNCGIVFALPAVFDSLIAINIRARTLAAAVHLPGLYVGSGRCGSVS
jgi:hypothetical protein